MPDNKEDELEKRLDELQQETEQVAAELEQIRSQRRQELAEAVVRNVDALLEIVPTHNRTSCSDKTHCNYGRCVRCTLIQIKEEQWFNGDDLTFELLLRTNREY